jgi:hypothetical protein
MKHPKGIYLGDDKRLVAVTSRHGTVLPIYDDSFGPLWIVRDSMGISGIIRAQGECEAWEISEDEFFPEAGETVEELQKEYAFIRKHVKEFDAAGKFTGWKTVETPNPYAWSENELFQEAYGFRPSGPNSKDKIGHGIYAKDLNGEYLDLLTEAMAKELELTIVTEDW